MLVKILGSAAGGGFPQWNCNTRLSRLAWGGDERVQARTQSSIAVSANGADWLIVNASPDIRHQILANPELEPRRNGALRNSPIRAVLLTNGDIDHIAGLLSLRERSPFSLYATERVLSVLDDNSVFNVLAHDVVRREDLPLNVEIVLQGLDGLRVEAFAIPGKVALYLEDPSKVGFGTEIGDTIGLKVSAPSSAALFYIPACAYVDDRLRQRIGGAGCLLFDGTLFTETEMTDLGVGTKTSRRMGHVPIAGEDGSLHAFDAVPLGKKVYIHINTTNPILEVGSEAERSVRASGWDIAFDGMTLTL